MTRSIDIDNGAKLLECGREAAAFAPASLLAADFSHAQPPDTPGQDIAAVFERNG
jgi:hypothetical protein